MFSCRASFTLTFPVLPLNLLHELVHLAKLLVAHLVYLLLIELLALPSVALNSLRIELPFSQESNLSYSQRSFKPPVFGSSNNVDRVFNTPMCSELAFDIIVTKYALLDGQPSMAPQEASIQWNWRQ